MALSTSTSTSPSVATSSSVSLTTPADSSANLSVDDPFSASISGPGRSYIPDPSVTYDYDEYDSAPLEPTLPSPSPSTPTASFLIPVRPSTSIPILSAISLRRKQQRKKKLIITHPIFAETSSDPDMDDGEGYRRELERKRIFEELYHWCRSFGAVKTMKQKGDSLHVHWKSWEAADLVCRVQGHVNIANIGTVCVTWQYV
ncbi:hypothetical protein K474DRAFT_1607435 [Panus rudis PR-1116 ss-1]|nr:hypothetical protein K474DRAFT_1607435 [Panus rudis PR-1116 ss-1]